MLDCGTGWIRRLSGVTAHAIASSDATKARLSGPTRHHRALEPLRLRPATDRAREVGLVPRSRAVGAVELQRTALDVHPRPAHRPGRVPANPRMSGGSQSRLG